jgi:long-chain acyl-CoA synthetase
MVYKRVGLSRTAAAAAPWLRHYPDWVPATLSYPSMSAWRLVADAARRRPDGIACRFFEQELTFAELLKQSRRAASALKGLSVQPGDRVALLLPNVPEFLIALNGIWMAGAVAVPLSPLLVAEEVSQLLESTDCRVVVSLDLFAHLVFDGEFRPRHTVLVSLRDRLPLWKQLPYALARWQRNGVRNHSTGTWFEEVLGKSRPMRRAVRRRTEQPAVIMPTGGTTDQSKAVVLTHRNLVANAYQLRRWVGAHRGRETVLAVLPFFHSFGLTVCGTTGLSLGAKLVLCPRFKSRNIIQMIERERPTIFPAVPMMLAALNERLRGSSADLSSLRYCISGGAPLETETAAAFAERSGATVVEGYGLTEASPVTHTGPLDGSARPGTIGLPLPGTDARIVDAETGSRRLGPGKVGELIVRGPQVMAGYWNDPEATGRALRRGWLYTGDLASCDSDGFFRIVDRKKDMIIAGGFNVFPGEVEEVIRGFPGVADAAVIGVPDVIRGEQVKALIVPRAGDQVDHKALERHCARHLAKYKRPRVIQEVQGELPRNFLGKVLRRELRENGTPTREAVAN